MSTEPTILLAVDDDDVSFRAAGAVTNWFSDDAKVVALHVAEPFGPSTVPVAAGALHYGTLAGYPYATPSVFRGHDDADLERGRSVAERAAEIADGEARVEAGGPAELIIDVAKQIHADVIIVGTGDRSWLSRLLQPSVSEAVVDEAPCSVLVVRPQADDRTDAA